VSFYFVDYCAVAADPLTRRSASPDATLRVTSILVGYITSVRQLRWNCSCATCNCRHHNFSVGDAENL